jgi:hypothetical protein
MLYPIIRVISFAFLVRLWGYAYGKALLDLLKALTKGLVFGLELDALALLSHFGH